MLTELSDTGEEPVPPARVLGAVGEGLAEISLSGDTTAISLGWGGDAANVCVMAARLGARARLLGRVGRDALGRGMIAFWRSNGVDVSWVREDPGASTGLYLNEPEGGGNGHRFVYHRQLSAGSRLEPADLDASFVRGLGLLVVTGVSLAVSRSSAATALAAVREARAVGAKVACILNHRPMLGGDPHELAELAVASDILIASEEDFVQVFGSADPFALGAVGEQVSEVIVTAGARPATVMCAGTILTQEVPVATVGNAAGAGDALAGAYLACRLLDQDPARCLRWGVAAATLSVARGGCASAYPNAADTAALVEAMPGAEPVSLG